MKDSLSLCDICFLLHVQVSAWGGYVFIINLIPLHVFVLLLMGRYSNRIFVGKHSQVYYSTGVVQMDEPSKNEFSVQVS